MKQNGLELKDFSLDEELDKCSNCQSAQLSEKGKSACTDISPSSALLRATEGRACQVVCFPGEI